MAFPDLVIKRGVTFPEVEISFADGSGVPMNLVGWSVYADVCEQPSSVASFSLNPTIVSAESGVVKLSEITPSGSMALKVGDYHWDLVLQNTLGQRLGPYIEGAVSVISVNTKP
jgi:hypothetical protein